MKRLTKILLLFLCLQYAILPAQPKRDKIMQLHKDFIIKKLELNETAAEKFWTVYNEYNQKVRDLKKNLRQNYRQKSQPLSDADAEELYQLSLQSKQTEADLHKQYSQKLKEIIGVKKLVELPRAEEEFKREVISSIQRERED